jgi:hypothetical protein
MTTKTAEPTIAELTAEYGRLSYAVSQGDTIAAIKLERIEAKIEEINRAERRAAAAKLEEVRLTAEAEKQAAEGVRQAEEAAYQSAIVCRTAAYDLVQQVTDELVQAVQSALIAGNEAHACALRISVSPGITPSNAISTYLAWRLGRDGGGEVAGLSGMEPTFPAMRVNLVQSFPSQES